MCTCSILIVTKRLLTVRIDIDIKMKTINKDMIKLVRAMCESANYVEDHEFLPFILTGLSSQVNPTIDHPSRSQPSKLASIHICFNWGSASIVPNCLNTQNDC